jgi:flagellar hook-associated protein FlgK
MSLSISSASNLVQSAGTIINRATNAASNASAAVASATSVNEMLPAMIDARQQLLYTQAAAKMISTANAMMGSLIDTHA